MTHCEDNAKDRTVGAYWERQFCRMAAQNGKSFTPLQLGRETSAQAYKANGTRWRCYTLPDVTVWTAPGEHHEIKHKAPTRSGRFGLEVYRYTALVWFANETGQDVLYTIHNHALSGGRDAKQNDISHWITATIMDLSGKWANEAPGWSWVNGKKKQVPIYYWPMSLWVPLSSYWAVRCAS